MSRRSFWEVLGLTSGEGAGATDIRRAYARRLRVTNPEDDPEGFVELREAYEFALAYVGGGGRVRRSAPAATQALPELEDATGGDLHDQAHDPQPDRREAAPQPQPEETPPVPTEEELAYEAILVEDTRKFRAQVAELEDLLRAAPFKPGPAMICLKGLLNSPALQTLTTQIAFEAELEQILLRNLPAADSLLTLVIERFRWKSTGDYRQAYRVGDRVLERQESLYQLGYLERPEHSLHKGYVALISKPTSIQILRWKISPGLNSQVARVLHDFRTNHPGLLDKLELEAIAWWDNWLSKPHLPFLALWCLGILGPVVVFSFWAQTDLAIPKGASPLMTFAIAIAIAGALSVGLGAAILHGVLRPRARWRQEGSALTAPSWLKWGWAPAALALPLVAALLADMGFSGGLPLLGISLTGAIVVGWTRVVAEPYPGRPQANPVSSWLDGYLNPGQWPKKALFQSILPGAVWLQMATLMPLPTWGLITAALLAFAGVIAVGQGSLSQRLRAFPRPSRQKGYSAVGALIAILALFSSTFGIEPGLQPWLAVFVMHWALMSPILDDMVGESAIAPRFMGLIGLLCVMWIAMPLTFVHSGGALRINGVWLLAGCLVTLALAMKGDRPKPSGKPLKLS